MEAGGSNMCPRPPLCARNVRTLLYHQLYEDGANSGSSLGKIMLLLIVNITHAKDIHCLSTHILASYMYFSLFRELFEM